MSSFQTRDKFRRPELFLSEILRKGSQGLYSERDENSRVFYRALVVAVDVVGGRLENPDGSGRLTHVIDGRDVDVPATVGPPNPQNSVKARVITAGADQFITNDRLRVFWPFLPEHVSVPIKPGEHVYVMFEDEGFDHGLWVTKVPGHEGVNFVAGQSTFGRSSDTTLVSLFHGPPSSGQELNTDAAASEVLRSDGRLASLFGR